MLTSDFFTIAKTWKQPKGSSLDEWVKKLWYIYTVKYYAAQRKKKHLPLVTAQMEVETIMLSEISQLVKKQIPYGLTYKRNLMNKLN